MFCSFTFGSLHKVSCSVRHHFCYQKNLARTVLCFFIQLFARKLEKCFASLLLSKESHLNNILIQAFRLIFIMFSSIFWKLENEENTSKKIFTHKLYDQNISDDFSIANVNTFFFKKIILSNKWKYMIVSLNDATRYLRWSENFTTKNKIIKFDRDYDQSIIIQKNETNVYVVCYDNCHLTKNHLRIKKIKSRLWRFDCIK